jgi:hypothetical protein
LDEATRLEGRMRVRELQEHLSKLDPGFEVLCYTEDEALVGEGNSGFLDIEAVDTVKGERFRNDEGVPCIRFVQTALAESMVLLRVTSDF